LEWPGVVVLNTEATTWVQGSSRSTLIFPFNSGIRFSASSSISQILIWAPFFDIVLMDWSHIFRAISIIGSIDLGLPDTSEQKTKRDDQDDDEDQRSKSSDEVTSTLIQDSGQQGQESDDDSSNGGDSDECQWHGVES
jgi:hypothetical protein